MKSFRIDYILMIIGVFLFTAGSAGCSESALPIGNCLKLIAYGTGTFTIGALLNLLFDNKSKDQ